MATNLKQILRQLAYTFTAKDIMVPKADLKFGSNESEARNLLDQYPNYDIIPIDQKGLISSYVKRSSQRVRNIITRDLVSEATSILDLVDILQDRKFCFVLVANRIGGYVHFSDLNNHLVKLPYFIIFEALERHLIESIRPLVDEETLMKILDPQRFTAIKDMMRRQRQQSADLDWVSLLSFDEILRCSCDLGKIRLKPEEVKQISETRNCVCHADRIFVKSHNDIKRLAKVKTLCISLLADAGI